MKTETVTRYKAFDGTKFDTAADCRAHEKDKAPQRIVGLTLEQIQAALDRTDSDLADALEEVGKRIVATRIEQGDRRRKPRAAKASGDTNGGASTTDGSTAGDEPASEDSRDPDEIPASLDRRPAAVA